MEVTAFGYTDCFEHSDLLVANLQCLPSPVSLTKKQLIFLVDASSAMKESMPLIRTILLSIRNTLVEKTTNIRSVEEYDRLLAQNVHGHLITFNDRASCSWNSSSNQDFSAAVSSISTAGKNNLHQGLSMAFDYCVEEYATWIILLTDGCPKAGHITLPESFSRMTLPPRTHIISVGVGASFDPLVLQSLGPVLQVQNDLSKVITLMEEILTAYGVNGQIIPSYSPASAEEEDMIGSRNFGVLSNQRSIIYAYCPWGKGVIGNIEEFRRRSVTVCYCDIVSGNEVKISCRIDIKDKLPADVWTAYLNQEEERLLTMILRARKYGVFDRDMVHYITEVINSWSSASHSDRIRAVLNDGPIDPSLSWTTLHSS